MVAVTVEMVRQLREETSAGVMACKRALSEANGDFARARSLLQEWGLASARKLTDRAASQGVIEAYVHPGERIGVLLELNCETDFVARTEEFRTLAHELALQVAAAAPQYVAPEDIPANSGEHQGQDVAQLALLAQPYIRDPERTVQELVEETSARTGEHVRIRRFVRYELAA